MNSANNKDRQPAYLRELCRELRRHPTRAEAILWECLRNRRTGAKFRRQQVIGRYIADFYCAAHRLVVELDGSVHREQIGYDKQRQTELEAQGYTVLRFSNERILQTLEEVLKEIALTLNPLRPHPDPLPGTPSPQPSPSGRGKPEGQGEGIKREREILPYCLILIVLILSFIFSLNLQAAPAAPQPYTLRQPDGGTFRAQSYGDEWSNGVETDEGFTILLNKATGIWEYAVRGPDGRLQPSGVRVGNGNVRPAGLAPHLRPASEYIVRPAQELPHLAPQNTPAGSATGPARTLVILVAFQDQAPIGTTPAYWHDIYFGSQSSSHSVADFYREASYGQLQLTPAQIQTPSETAADGIVGWLQLPVNHPDTRDQIIDANRALTAQALKAADPFVDFSKFDTNGDGKLSANELHLVVIVAGYEASYGGAANTCTPHSVWSHHWTLTEVLTLDGVVIGDSASGGGSYAQSGEWHCRSDDNPGHPATLGVLAHELGHDLGWGAPDLYDLDGSSYGIGRWDLMSLGAWTGVDAQGDSPAHPSAWTKWFFGWIDPVPVQGQLPSLTLTDAERNSNQFYLLGQNPNGVDWLPGQPGTGEYFLIENRQNIGYDKALPSHGLLIWHIDESVPDNSNEADRLVDLEEANGTQKLDCVPQGNSCPYGNKGDESDPFPGSLNAQFFNETSVPNSHYYNGNPSNVSLSAIKESGMKVTVDVRMGNPPAPNQAPTAAIVITGQRINPCKGLDSCVLLGTKVQLDGSGSTDPNPGDVLQYRWIFITTPAGSRIRAGRSFTGPRLTFSPDREGSYQVQLTVADQQGGQDSKTATIEARAQVLFQDDMENPTAGWVSEGSAHRLVRTGLDCNIPNPAPEFSSGNYLWYLGDPATCSYASDITLFSPPINVLGVTKVGMSFNYFLRLRKGDQLDVSASFDGSIRWRRIWSMPKQGVWTSTGQRMLMVPQGAASVVLRFHIVRSSKFKNIPPGLGWLIDDLRMIKLAGTLTAGSGPAADETDLNRLRAAAALLLKVPPSAQGWIARAEIFGTDGHLVDRTEWAVATPEGVRWGLSPRGPVPANGVYLVVLSLRTADGKIVSRQLMRMVWLR